MPYLIQIDASSGSVKRHAVLTMKPCQGLSDMLSKAQRSTYLIFAKAQVPCLKAPIRLLRESAKVDQRSGPSISSDLEPNWLMNNAGVSRSGNHSYGAVPDRAPAFVDCHGHGHCFAAGPLDLRQRKQSLGLGRSFWKELIYPTGAPRFVVLLTAEHLQALVELEPFLVSCH